MHLILHELTAMQNFYYLYADARDGAAPPGQTHGALLRVRLCRALLACDAEVIFWGANYDQDVTWPPFFEEEIVPWLQMVSDRAHAAGKLLLTHCDGETSCTPTALPSMSL
jgi:hypothetical protein